MIFLYLLDKEKLDILEFTRFNIEDLVKYPNLLDNIIYWDSEYKSLSFEIHINKKDMSEEKLDIYTDKIEYLNRKTQGKLIITYRGYTSPLNKSILSEEIYRTLEEMI